jgi:hypothetical protein
MVEPAVISDSLNVYDLRTRTLLTTLVVDGPLSRLHGTDLFFAPRQNDDGVMQLVVSRFKVRRGR